MPSDDYIAFERQEDARRLEAVRRRRKRIDEALPRIVAALSAFPNVQRAILFGSVARGDVAADSDIDIAVEGLSPADYVRLWLRIEEAAGGVSFDLVELDKVSSWLRDVIVEEGAVIYDRAGAGEKDSGSSQAADHYGE